VKQKVDINQEAAGWDDTMSNPFNINIYGISSERQLFHEQSDAVWQMTGACGIF
jgi:hypothetical protein